MFARRLSRSTRTSGRVRVLAAILAASFGAVAFAATPAEAAAHVPISGSGSTWSSNAVLQWASNVNQYGIKVNFAPTGSSQGRTDYRNGAVDFAISEIPYGLTDGGVVDTPPQRKYAYMPIVAGGTSFMYNIKIGGKLVTNLRLSGETIARIFTGGITKWNDPAVAKDNPGLTLPALKVVPVVRSDGSGTTAQLTTWLSKTYPSIWNSYCVKAGRKSPCGITSTYPTVPGSGFVAQAQSTNVAGYVAQKTHVGTITYVEYSYALYAGYPVAKMLNKSGYYVEPTAKNVAVGLLGAKINNNANSSQYLTQDLSGVYSNPDKRAYPLSSYSYMIIPTKLESNFSTDKGYTLGDFAYYFLCEGQQQVPDLGYSPLPINLVKAGLSQIKKIPGVQAQAIDIAKCDNPTFSKDGSNTLAKTAPYPAACDKYGTTQCSTGTGGAKGTSTRTKGDGGGSGSGSGTGSDGGAGSGTGSGGGTGTTNGTGGTGGAVDAEGLPVSGGDGAAVNADGVTAVAVTLASPPGWGLQDSLMVLAGFLLLAIVIGPPLFARSMRNREDNA